MVYRFTLQSIESRRWGSLMTEHGATKQPQSPQITLSTSFGQAFGVQNVRHPVGPTASHSFPLALPLSGRFRGMPRTCCDLTGLRLINDFTEIPDFVTGLLIDLPNLVHRKSLPCAECCLYGQIGRSRLSMHSGRKVRWSSRNREEILQIAQDGLKCLIPSHVLSMSSHCA